MTDSEFERTQPWLGMSTETKLAVVRELESSGFVEAREVGRGGFGIVFRCVEVSLNRTVAVKVLTSELDHDNIARFEREQQAMGKLMGHPNIMTVLYTGVTDHGRPYIVMPMLSIESLATRLHHSGPLSIGEVLRLGVKTAGALETAHNFGILHRDIKPANLLFTDNSEPVLTDFGISHFAGGFVTTDALITGTPAYTAPEVLEGKTATAAADIYSLGALLFSAATGHTAFERLNGEQVVAQFLRITRNSSPKLPEMDIPIDLTTVIEQAMSTDPAKRPSRAVEVGEALREAQARHRLSIDEMVVRFESEPPDSGSLVSQSGRLMGDQSTPPIENAPLARFREIPYELTSFIGRRTEITETKHLLTTGRLVTLIGIGGVGKSRLALQVARDVRRKFTDGTWFIELADLEHGALLADVVVASLGLRQDSTRSSQANLTNYFAPRKALLILDNCEHIIDSVAALTDELLRYCPELHILTTSREVLGVGGETVLRVPPLSAPASAPLALGRSSQYDAVALFVDRATAAVHTFAITNANQAAVAQICRQLDGLPLALELAAARLRALSVEQLLQRISDRFAALTLGERTAPTRQQTLRLCVDWSYELCTTAEQRAWTQLSVFASSFELSAAERVVTPGKISLTDILTALVDKSILLREEDQYGVRFRMLETLRDYGFEKLSAAGEEESSRRRHAEWYLRLAVTARDQWISPRQLEWIARLSLDQPNLREAANFFLSSHAVSDESSGLQLVTSLYPFWLARGYYSEGRKWLNRALLHDSELPAKNVAQAIYASSALADLQGDFTAASKLLERGRLLTSPINDIVPAGYIDQADGVLAIFHGELLRARSLLEKAIAVFDACGDLVSRVDTQIKLGLVLEFLGFGDLAVDCYKSLLDITGSHKESVYRSFALWSMAITVWRQGDSGRAKLLLSDSLRLARKIDDPVGAATCLEVLAWILASDGDTERVGTLMGAAEELGRAAGTSSVLLSDLQIHHDETVRLMRSRFPDRFNTAVENGRQMKSAEAIAYALSEPPPEPDIDDLAARLTKREKQIAELIAQGLTDRLIAAQLVISERTVHGHVQHILEKLAFTSRTQVAAWIAEHHQHKSQFS